MTNALDIGILKKRIGSFERNLWGDEFAHQLARVTLGWGAIEHLLYLVLEAIDTKKSGEWTVLLFEKRNLARRKDIVLQQVTKAVYTSYPAFVDAFTAQLANLQAIQERRNLLAHGLWLRGKAENSFNVQPLALSKHTGTVEDPVTVDIAYLAELLQDMSFLEQGLASLVSEMLAHQWLKKRGRL